MHYALKNLSNNFSEPFLEAIPQVHILMCLWFNNDTMIIGDLNNGFSKDSILFLITYSTSVLSAAFGIAKFLKSGPCRLISNEGGYFQMGFLLIMISTFCCLAIKAILLSLVCAPWIAIDKIHVPIWSTMVIWLSLNYLPQFIFVCLIVLVSVGFKKSKCLL